MKVIYDKIITDNDLTVNDFKLFILIFSMGELFASNQWIANKLNTSERTVIRSINRLAIKKYIFKTKKYNKRTLIISF